MSKHKGITPGLGDVTKLFSNQKLNNYLLKTVGKNLNQELSKVIQVLEKNNKEGGDNDREIKKHLIPIVKDI
jgi:hypothetical protein